MSAITSGFKNNLKNSIWQRTDTALQTLFLPATNEYKEFFFETY